MASKVWTLFLLAILAIVHGNDNKFTTRTNLEKLFYMESEVMSLIDVYVREEHFAHDGEDVHDLGDIKKFTEEMKKLHRDVRNMTEYLAHPINVLHLTRRFIYEWQEALSAVMDSEPCKKWNIPEVKRRMANIKKNLPRKADLHTVALSIARIQYTQDLKMNDFFKGVIFGRKPYQPMTAGDLLDIAWAAYEGGQYLFTTLVAEEIIKGCKNASRKDGCDDPKLFKMAAACFYKINKVKEAVEMTQRILDKDPEDRAAKRNMNFYSGRLKSGRILNKEYVFDITNLKYYETCRGERKMDVSQTSRLRCKLIPSKHWFVFEKAEYHHNNPPVVEFHQTFHNNYITMIRNAGEQGFKKQAYADMYDTPQYRTRPPPTHVYSVFSDRFLYLLKPLIWPLDIGTVEVRQSGMEGMYFPPKDRVKFSARGAHIGSFFTFINENYIGGEFVFPKYKLKIKPTLGNTIFFFATKSTMNICPVAYGSQWYAIQSLFEIKMRRVCRPHEADLEKRIR